MQTEHFPKIKRGDSIEAFDFMTVSQDGEPLAVASAFMQVRETNGRLVYEWNTAGESPNMLITGAGNNVIRMLRTSESVTRGFPTGTHRYDTEITLVSGQVITPIGGEFPVEADVSIPTTA